jgi:hypothetical protein
VAVGESILPLSESNALRRIFHMRASANEEKKVFLACQKQA